MWLSKANKSMGFRSFVPHPEVTTCLSLAKSNTVVGLTSMAMQQTLTSNTRLHVVWNTLLQFGEKKNRQPKLMGCNDVKSGINYLNDSNVECYKRHYFHQTSISCQMRQFKSNSKINLEWISMFLNLRKENLTGIPNDQNPRNKNKHDHAIK